MDARWLVRWRVKPLWNEFEEPILTMNLALTYLMPPAIIRCEYASKNFVAQALAAGWCATGITLVDERSPGTRSRFSPHPTSDAGEGSLRTTVGGMR
jgi:hypothetical protein